MEEKNKTREGEEGQERRRERMKTEMEPKRGEMKQQQGKERKKKI